MRLYKVETEVFISSIVVADSFEEAIEIAEANRGDILEQSLESNDSMGVFEAVPLEKDEKLPPGWSDTCVPFGKATGNEEKEIGELR